MKITHLRDERMNGIRSQQEGKDDEGCKGERECKY